MDLSQHTSGFVTVSGVRLHYLDWGGSGPALLFIPGWGCTAHIFDGFAPRFTDQFHVLALTRRGHGESDYPEVGYDPDTLANDVKQFLDALQIEQVILAGHSFGSVELARFAALYPERVLKLIWIDAAYDCTDPEYKALMAKNPQPKMMPPWPNAPIDSLEEFAATIRRLYPSLAAIWGPEMEADMRANVSINAEGHVVEKVTDAINAALSETISTYRPDYGSIRAPMLAIFVLIDGADFLSAQYMTVEQQAQVLDFFKHERLPYKRKYIEGFRCAVPQAQIVEILGGHHYCFLKQAYLTYEAMRAFLRQA